MSRTSALLGIGGIIIAGIFAVRVFYSGFFSAAKEIVIESFEKMSGASPERLAMEISLSPSGNSVTGSFAASNSLFGKTGTLMRTNDIYEELPENAPNNKAISKTGTDSAFRGVQERTSSSQIAALPNSSSALPDNATNAARVAGVSECAFSTGNISSYKALLNEVAWMGTDVSPSDEWIEITGSGNQNISIAGWRLMNESGNINVIFESGTLSGNSFFLLERTDDSSVSGIKANIIYKGALSNAGEWLRIFDASCGLVDEIDARQGWPAGDNATKRTMERKEDRLWQTSALPGGTPGKTNSSVAEKENPTTQEDETYGESSSGQNSSSAPTTLKISINEVFYDAEGADDGKEFIELLNESAQEIDLSDWKVLYNGKSIVTIGGNSEDAVIVSAGGYFLLGFNKYASTPSAQVVRSASLPNTPAVVALLDANGLKIDEASYDGSAVPGESVERVRGAATMKPATPTPGK